MGGQSKNSCPRFREFDRRVFEKSLEWLNDPEIKYLIVAPDSDRESRERWFNSLKQINLNTSSRSGVKKNQLAHLVLNILLLWMVKFGGDILEKRNIGGVRP